MDYDTYEEAGLNQEMIELRKEMEQDSVFRDQDRDGGVDFDEALRNYQLTEQHYTRLDAVTPDYL